MANEAFVWGRAGRKLTPDQVAKEREAADLLAKGAMDYSPVAHWSQGLNRVAQGLLAGIDYRMADKAEEEIGTVNKDLIASLLSGGSSAPATSSAIPMTSAAGEVSATAPAPAIDISGDKQTFIASLLPAAIEESKRTGVDPRIIVAQAAQETGWGKSAPGNNYFGIKSHGKGGGQSLMTTEYVDGKPVKMRDSFRGYGSPAESVRGYGDFILENPRYKPLREAQGLDAQLAALGASGYATDPNYASSVGSIARGIQLPTEIAAATPEAAIEAVAPLEDPVDVPAAPAVASATAPPVQVAQASGINPAIIEALTNPQATPQTQRIAAMLLQQEQEKQQMAEEQRLQAADPLRQLQLQKGQLELEQMRNPGPQPLINAGNGAVYDPNTGAWLQAPNSTQKPPQVVELFDEATGQPYKATWNPETGQYERVGGVKARSGMQLTTNPDGTVTLTEGAIGGLPKLTEAEGRNSGFYGRGVESQKVLNDLEAEGTSLANKVSGAIPIFGNFLRGEGAQKYDQAKRDFINAVLRRESGAVISPEEFKNAEQQYFPQPGDGPEVIAQKRKNRDTTIQGLKISAGQGAGFAVPSEQPQQQRRLKFNPATGELE